MAKSGCGLDTDNNCVYSMDSDDIHRDCILYPKEKKCYKGVDVKDNMRGRYPSFVDRNKEYMKFVDVKSRIVKDDKLFETWRQFIEGIALPIETKREEYLDVRSEEIVDEPVHKAKAKKEIVDEPVHEAKPVHKAKEEEKKETLDVLPRITAKLGDDTREVFKVESGGGGDCFYYAILGCLIPNYKKNTEIMLKFRTLLAKYLSIDEIKMVFETEGQGVNTYLESFSGRKINKSEITQLSDKLTKPQGEPISDVDLAFLDLYQRVLSPYNKADKTKLEKKLEGRVFEPEILVEFYRDTIQKQGFWAHFVEVLLTSHLLARRGSEILQEMKIDVKENLNLTIIVDLTHNLFYHTLTPNPDLPTVTIYNYNNLHFQSVYYLDKNDKLHQIWMPGQQATIGLFRLYKTDDAYSKALAELKELGLEGVNIRDTELEKKTKIQEILDRHKIYTSDKKPLWKQAVKELKDEVAKQKEAKVEKQQEAKVATQKEADVEKQQEDDVEKQQEADVEKQQEAKVAKQLEDQVVSRFKELRLNKISKNISISDETKRQIDIIMKELGVDEKNKTRLLDRSIAELEQEVVSQLKGLGLENINKKILVKDKSKKKVIVDMLDGLGVDKVDKMPILERAIRELQPK